MMAENDEIRAPDDKIAILYEGPELICRDPQGRRLEYIGITSSRLGKFK
jgi:hypothetical protein